MVEQGCPKVSVVIPCYNQGVYVDEAVRSVSDQTFQDFEIIIVNDGSTDDFSNTLLASYNRPKTTVFHIENRGLSGARNFGISKSRGEYILPLDSDDKFRPTYLEKAVAILDKNAEIGFVTCWVEVFGEEEFIWKTHSFDLKEALVQNRIGTCLLYRKRCWEEVCGYDESMRGYMDWNFWISIGSKGWKGDVITEPLFLYRRRTQSMLTESNKMENRLKLIAKIIDNNVELYKDSFKYVIIGKERRLAETEELAASLNSRILKIKSSPLFKMMEKSGLFWVLKRLKIIDFDLLKA